MPWYYYRGMKVKTSITLSEDLLEAIEERSADYRNRSDFIETAIRDFLARKDREELNAKDLAILNQNADRLNQEAEDVLAFQALP